MPPPPAPESAAPMTTLHTRPAFDDPALHQRLEGMDDAALDALGFGVIGIDAQGLVCRYNAYESRLAGLSPGRVIGRSLFSTVAPCMNNAMVAQRFHAAVAAGLPLDDRLDYVLSLHMRPVAVRLRLLSDPVHALRYVVVRRPE